MGSHGVSQVEESVTLGPTSGQGRAERMGSSGGALRSGSPG